MTFAWVQKAADGSVCKLWHTIVHKVCNLIVTNHEKSEKLQYNTKQDLILIWKKILMIFL